MVVKAIGKLGLHAKKMSGKYAETINELAFVMPAFTGAMWEDYSNTGPVCDCLSYLLAG